MNKLVGENNWTIDLENPDKLLSVNSDEVSVQEIINTVQKVDYSADTQK
jgi:copper chaperone